MLDPKNPAGAKLRFLGRVVSGEIESACHEGGIYRPADLRELTGLLKEKLCKLAADLWLWRATENWGRRKANSKTVSGAVAALEDLEKLKKGVALFGPPVEQFGGIIVIQGRRLELAPQLADILFRALAPGGFSVENARKQFGLSRGEENQISSRLAKLRVAVRKQTSSAPFCIEITTSGGCVTARVRPKQDATKMLPKR
jgi:hypothetical protein